MTLLPSLESEPLLQQERLLWSEGYQTLAGIDEAGRGPLAGPVVAACAYIPKNVWIPGIYDSKKISEKQRNSLFDQITKHPAIQYGIGIVDEKIIDEVNIYQATILAMKQALEEIQTCIDYVLVDGMQLALKQPSLKMIKGDSRSYLIAAASILAKVTRDRIMQEYDCKWPEYGFKTHKGYGTAKHRKAIEIYGPCEIHRKTFEPIKSFLLKSI